MHLFRLLACWLCCLWAMAGPVSAKVMPVEFDAGRNRLIAYLLSHQLPAQHFEHLPLDDRLSKAAFDLYLRQLDPRKRFLLRPDVEQLQAFADHIDDELQQGHIVLPDVGAQILKERIREVESMLDGILNAGFDPDRVEYLESDPKKTTNPADRKELRDRWRRILKMQVLDEYLDQLDQEKKKAEKNGSKGPKAEFLEGRSVDLKIWTNAVAKIRKRNHHFLQRLLKETRQEYYNRYFDTVARAFDPHTNYMPPTSKEDFDIHMSGSLEGIGALLREDDGQIKVVRIIPGSAAERQGELHAEDIILAVSEKDGEPVDITDMRIREAVSYIRGPKGTEVRLTVQKPDGSKHVIAIVRDVVQIEETYVKSTVLENPESQRIGYLRIPSFYRDFSDSSEKKGGRNATDDTRRELHKLKEQHISGLILDLRNNGGGSLSDAVDISGLFLPGGPVVQVKNSQGMIRVLEDTDYNVAYDGPVLVLVNQFSASASEILAAAMQDYRRALIVGGKHTHGKGTVQALLDLNRNLPLLHLKKYDDLGALKITIQKFYRINGGSTQYKGVEPDLVLPSMLDYLKTGEQYLDHSLPWDQVDSIPFNAWTGKMLDVNKARRLGEQYVASSKKFQKISEESARAKERSEQTRVKIFLQGMIKERAELQRARREARAAGVLQEEDGGQDGEQDEKKDLREELRDDPYVNIALYLFRKLLP